MKSYQPRILLIKKHACTSLFFNALASLSHIFVIVNKTNKCTHGLALFMNTHAKRPPCIVRKRQTKAYQQENISSFIRTPTRFPFMTLVCLNAHMIIIISEHCAKKSASIVHVFSMFNFRKPITRMFS